MKHILIIFLTICSVASFAQLNEPKVRSIEVKGSSEMEVTPDEIFVQVTLKEYKRGGDKVSLNTLESGLIKALRKLNIPEENLRVENVYGYNWNWRKRKTEEFMGSKSFILEVNDLKMINNLIESLDPEGVSNMNVRSYAHSQIEDLRKKVKIGAMQAAKEKATYLLASIDAELGKVIQVQEIEYGNPGYEQRRSNFALEADVSSYQSEVDFKKIKVRAEMRVVFEIE